MSIEPRKRPRPTGQLQQEILQNVQQNQRQERRVQRHQQQSHSTLRRFYLAIIMNLFLLLTGSLMYFKPKIFFRLVSSLRRSPTVERLHNHQAPPRHLALLYPPGISPSKDLPVLYGPYSIATPENLPARRAVRKVKSMREQLNRQVVRLLPWTREDVLRHPLDDYCERLSIEETTTRSLVALLSAAYLPERWICGVECEPPSSARDRSASGWDDSRIGGQIRTPSTKLDREVSGFVVLIKTMAGK